MRKNNLPLVVIFGRTNVGKSTIFNKLTETRQAMVADYEGVTRDSNIGEAEWIGKKFLLVDTGGIMELKYLFEKSSKHDDIEAKVQSQARDYLKRADLILFVVDAKDGLLPQDKQMAIALKKILPNFDNVLLIANKSDSRHQRDENPVFYQLGLGEPISISAVNGSGTGDMLDVIVKRLKKNKTKEQDMPSFIRNVKKDAPESVKVSIIGRPNVGKSSLLNTILKEERVIVSPIAHTTREPQDTHIEYKDREIKLIDTAGITRRGLQSSRQKLSVKETLEKYGIDKSLSTLNRSDIAIFVWDVTEELIHQDLKIIEEIIERGKSLIIIGNKWDKAKERDTKKVTNYFRSKVMFTNWAPIIFVSAKTGEKTKKILDLILEIADARKIEIGDSVLNTFMMKLVKMHHPTKGRGVKHPRIRKFFMSGSNPPKFEIRIGSEEDLHFSYVRFVENRIREKFGFNGTPIKMNVVKNRKIHSVRD